MATRKRLGSDEDDEPEVPGYKNYLVYTDESGMHAGAYYGFGTFWIPWERRGDLWKEVEARQERHGLWDEIKWKKQSRRSEALARDLIDMFFKQRWMMFHCLLVNKALVDRAKHKNRDEQQQKHFSMLLRNKIAYFARGGGKVYRVRIDNLSWRYPKADEVIYKIVNAQLKQSLGEKSIHDIVACDSSDTIGIQMADLLLGAAICPWQGEAMAAHKLRLTAHIAEHLGWSDLRHDTPRSEWKFNIWHFHDPRSGVPRAAKTQSVKLKHWMPPYRPRR